MRDTALALKNLDMFCGNTMTFRIYNDEGHQKTAVLIYWGRKIGQFVRAEARAGVFEDRFCDASSAAIRIASAKRAKKG